MEVSRRSGSFGFVCGWLLVAGTISCIGRGLASPSAVPAAGAGGQVVLDEMGILQQLA